MTKPISNNQSLIDSRDIIERIEELQDVGEYTIDEDEQDELTVLITLAEDCESEPDWQHGVTLIRNDHFPEYAKELAADLGALRDLSWPYNHIDWVSAAKDFQIDYSAVDFDGQTYWVRN